MNWRKWNNILHRDIGYFFFGLTVIYAISGIAANHLRQWDSNFVTVRNDYAISGVSSETPVDQSVVDNILKETGETGNYKSHFRPAPDLLQIFITGGIIDVNMATGRASVERKKSRPVLREMNFLHLNHGQKAWTWVADIYAFGLLLLAVTGLFVLKGKNGLTGRGKWFVAAGVLLPVIFLFLYFY